MIIRKPVSVIFEAGEQFAPQPAVWWVEQGPHDPLVVADDNFMFRYDIEPTTVDGLAGQIARRVATLGEPAIQIHGDGNQVVSKIGVGTGCCTTPAVFQDLGCDLSIVTDDGTWYWAQLQRAADGPSVHPRAPRDQRRTGHGDPGSVPQRESAGRTRRPPAAPADLSDADHLASRSSVTSTRQREPSRSRKVGQIQDSGCR
jgi:hypothetical protein